MQRYDFTPDYSAWWKKEDLSKDQICWLLLGVNPDDVARNGKTANKDASTIEEDKIWQNSFTRYLDTLPYGFRISGEHKYYMITLLWDGDRKAIVKQAYENYREFPESFRAFLGKGFPKNDTLEAYKNHENFKPNEPLSLDEITKEEDAFAILLGFKPKDFLRFYALVQRQNNEPKDENGFAAYVRFTPEDKWFYSEYRKFIAESYEGQEHFFAIRAWDEARFLGIWKGDFKEYAQRLYNEGFLFKRSVIESLQAKGVSFEYDEKGWAYDFYHYWIKRGGWTADEAVSLFKGQWPKNEGRSFIELSQNLWMLSAIHNGSIYAWDNHTLTQERLDRVLERHKAMGMLPTYPMKDVELFRPKEIIAWLLEQTSYIPPKPLLCLLEIEKTKEEEEERILANTKASEEQAKAKRKPPEIHKCIGWAWDAVKNENNGKPSAQDVWKKLQDNEELFTCIEKFDVSDKTREQAIFWKTSTGITDEMAFPTFRNIVSDLNKGRKTYDPSQNNF